MRGLVLCMLAAGLLAASPAAAETGGLPPFLAKMQRHDVAVHVLREGSGAPVGEGVRVGLKILAGGAEVREYEAHTDAAGVAHFAGIPTNPEVQDRIGYVASVDAGGVRFPFRVPSIPTGDGHVELMVPEVTTDLDGLRVEHGMIELFADEEALVVRHEMRLHNDGDRAVNLAALPGGGLELPLPAGAKHPELHQEGESEIVAVRGASVVYQGAVLPRRYGPALIRVIYTVPYRTNSTFEWRQALPVPATGGTVVVSRDKRPGQQRAVRLTLDTSMSGAQVAESELDGGRRFQILRAGAVRLDAGEPFRFTVSGLPTRFGTATWALLGAVAAVAGVLLLGFRRPAGDPAGGRLSRAHLEIERDRLLRALARMRKAVERGHMTETRFEREREAITARLVSLYRALDRLEGR